MVLPTAVDKLGEGGNHFQIKQKFVSTILCTILKDWGLLRKHTQLAKSDQIMTQLGIAQVFQNCNKVRDCTSAIIYSL